MKPTAEQMRETRRLFDVRAIAQETIDDRQSRADAAKSEEEREFWLNQRRKTEKALEEILNA